MNISCFRLEEDNIRAVSTLALRDKSLSKLGTCLKGTHQPDKNYYRYGDPRVTKEQLARLRESHLKSRALFNNRCGKI